MKKELSRIMNVIMSELTRNHWTRSQKENEKMHKIKIKMKSLDQPDVYDDWVVENSEEPGVHIITRRRSEAKVFMCNNNEEVLETINKLNAEWKAEDEDRDDKIFQNLVWEAYYEGFKKPFITISDADKRAEENKKLMEIEKFMEMEWENA